MICSKGGSTCGLSLLELTLAVALFSVVLGMAAQSLVSHQVALTTQTQRTVALNDCRSLLDAMRAFRDANRGDFPAALTERWAHGVPANGGALRGETLTVFYSDPQSNPLEVRVVARWRDLRGRPASLGLATLLTDR